MVPLYAELVMKGKGYIRRLQAANKEGDVRGRVIEADEFCQYCIDSSQTLMRVASEMERMVAELPEEEELLRTLAEINRAGAKKFGEIYKQCQEYQRKGIVPTNLPTF